MKSAASLVLVAALAAPLGAAEILEQVLVKVNGDIITKTELEQRQISALRARSNGQIDPELLKSDDALKKALAEVTPEVIVEAIDELLLLQLGKEKGYRLADDQFRSWLDNLRKEQNLQEEAKFQAALKQEGMTLDDLRRNVEKQFIINRVQQDEVGSKLTITEEEARQHYLSHKDLFVEPATVTLREILIEVPATKQGGQLGVNVGAEDDAMARAVAVRARLAAGEDFAKVAAEVSTAASKANGGLIGPIAVSQISPALQQLLEKMKPGDITEPLRAQRGAQILKLESAKPAEVQPFERVREVAADRVHAERSRTEVRKFLSRIRTQALIEWKNDELKKAYEKHVSGPGAPAGGAD
jgi:peptidyl-prolyl cis-trans isomerase SurA